MLWQMISSASTSFQCSIARQVYGHECNFSNCKHVTISQFDATQTALSQPLTHQLTVTGALMSHAQLTVSLRMVSQAQAAAGRLLTCQISIRLAAAHPALQTPV